MKIVVVEFYDSKDLVAFINKEVITRQDIQAIFHFSQSPKIVLYYWKSLL